MAVVSISKIQVRRGKKNEGSGLPQLSSGEFGWAIDTQELYIGNGSVSEGAPYVGNTKLLTERDNIFDLVQTYTYYADSDIAGTVARSLQARLDDRVSVKAFGIEGNDSDITDLLQQALNSLYVTPSVSLEESRVTLFIEPGIYRITNTITVPSYVSIVGAGKDKTFIHGAGVGPLFETETSTSLTYADQPQYISFKDLTVTLDNDITAFQLNSVRNSEFENIRISGPWRSTDEDSTTSTGFTITSVSQAVQTEHNSFKNIEFYGVANGILADHNFQHNLIDNCIFNETYCGISLGRNMSSTYGLPGQDVGGANNIFSNNSFTLCDYSGIAVEYGQQNISDNNRFFNVGNDGGSSETATHPVIIFNEERNMSSNDYFQRASELGTNAYSNSTNYPANISGPVSYKESFVNNIEVARYITPVVIMRIATPSSGTATIHYTYSSTLVNFKRTGDLVISFNTTSQEVITSDQYETTGPSTLDDDMYFELSMYSDSVEIAAANPTDQGTFSYTVEYDYS